MYLNQSYWKMKDVFELIIYKRIFVLRLYFQWKLLSKMISKGGRLNLTVVCSTPKVALPVILLSCLIMAINL